MQGKTHRSIEHRDVVDEHVFDNVDFAHILTQRSNGDSVGSVAVQVLHEDFGAVGLEGDAVCIIISWMYIHKKVQGEEYIPSSLLITEF